MKFLKNPWVRVIFIILLAASLLYMPTREFLKITCLLGILAVFLAAFMRKQDKRSRKWMIAALGLVVLSGTYLYFLTQLPERIEVRRIMATGSALTRQGQYDRAMAEYSKLEKLGAKNKMQAKLDEVEIEKKAQRDLELAKQMVKNGDYSEARKLINTIPRQTKAAEEAARILVSISDSNK